MQIGCPHRTERGQGDAQRTRLATEVKGEHGLNQAFLDLGHGWAIRIGAPPQDDRGARLDEIAAL